MKTLKEILENNEFFTLSEYDNIQYNAQDSPDHLQGKNSQGKKIFTRIYSVYAINIKENICFVQSRDAWGRIWDETISLSFLCPYVSEIKHI